MMLRLGLRYQIVQAEHSQRTAYPLHSAGWLIKSQVLGLGRNHENQACEVRSRITTDCQIVAYSGWVLKALVEPTLAGTGLSSLEWSGSHHTVLLYGLDQA